MEFLILLAAVSTLPTWFLIMFLNWKIAKIADYADQMEADIKLLQNEIEKLRPDLLG